MVCYEVEQFTQSPPLNIPSLCVPVLLSLFDCGFSSLCLGGAAGGGYAQVIPMEEVRSSLLPQLDGCWLQRPQKQAESHINVCTSAHMHTYSPWSCGITVSVTKGAVGEEREGREGRGEKDHSQSPRDKACDKAASPSHTKTPALFKFFLLLLLSPSPPSLLLHSCFFFMGF